MAEIPYNPNMSETSPNIRNEKESFRIRLQKEFEQIKLQRRMAERTKENLKQELLNEETLRWYHFKNKIENQREIARMRYGNIPGDMVRYLKPKDEYERQLERAKEEAELALEEQRLYLAARLPDLEKYSEVAPESPATTSQNSRLERSPSRHQLFVAGMRADLVKVQSSNHLKKSRN